MKQIPLTQGQFALVDDDDFERVNQFKWQAAYSPITDSFYAVRRTPAPERKAIWMARFIMQTPPDMICDHVNHDTLNNQKSNLRNCTRAENKMNQRSQNTVTGMKNIYVHKKRYRVEIMLDYKKVYLKSFKNLEEAIQARNEALKKYHGDFSNID
jgi:hypothetical protein